MQTEEQFISLFDHLNKAAGPELGKQVAEYAKIRNVPFRVRYVQNKNYTGNVMLYQPEFLKEFFRTRFLFKINPESTKIDNLPFGA
jgi:hypothetical protein